MFKKNRVDSLKGNFAPGLSDYPVLRLNGLSFGSRASEMNICDWIISG